MALAFHLEDGKYSDPAHTSHLVPPKGAEKTDKHFWSSQSRGKGLPKAWDLILELQSKFPAVTPHHHVIKACLQQGILVSISCQLLKKKKNYKIYQKTKIQFEETEQVSEPYMAGMLELSGQEFKTSVINMLRALMDKEENRWIMLSKEMEILRKNQTKC